MTDIQINPDFKNLIPPLSEDEYNQLEQNCINNGILDPVKLWNDVIVDGHNRHSISSKHGLGFKTKQLEFDSKEAVKIWIIDNQLGRRNINSYCRTSLETEKEAIIATQAKEKQRLGGINKVPQISSEPAAERETRNIIAKSAGVSHNTVTKVKAIKENATPELEEKVKRSEISINAASKIVRETPEIQNKIVEKLNEGQDKSTTQIHREVKREERREQLQTKEQTLPNDKYRVLYADPPWSYGNSGLDEYGHAERHYPTMTIDELCDLPIKAKADENAVLFLWVTSPLLEDSFKVIKSWGFKYKSSFIWDKIKHNFGYYNSVRHELLLVCTRGSCLPDEKKLYDSVQEIERGKHSEKPEEFRAIIDHLYNFGKKLELFARKDSEGWDSWGNE